MCNATSDSSHKSIKSCNIRYSAINSKSVLPIEAMESFFSNDEGGVKLVSFSCCFCLLFLRAAMLGTPDETCKIITANYKEKTDALCKNNSKSPSKIKWLLEKIK